VLPQWKKTPGIKIDGSTNQCGGFLCNFEVRESKHNNDDYCNPRSTLLNPSGNAQKGDIYPFAGLFAGSVIGGRRQLEKEGEGQRRR
jgi:hypothetical protein